MLLCSTLFVAAQQLWCPEPTNHLVNDYSGVLSSEQCSSLEQRLVAFDDSTSNQILVIITPTLHDCEIMDLGTRIGQTWGVGQKDQKNGVVILIKSKADANDYGDVAILPGYGLEGALPDALCNRIINDRMVKPLSQGNYYEAVLSALDVIEPACKGEYSLKRQGNGGGSGLAFGIMILVFVAVFLLANRYNKNHPNNNDKGDRFSDGSGNGGRNSAWPFFVFPRGGFGSGGFGSGGFGGFGGGSSGGFGGFGGGSFGGGGSHGRF